MIKAGVVIDDWKLKIFKKHLDANGYIYTQHPGLTIGTLILNVDVESAEALHPVVKVANAEAAEYKNDDKPKTCLTDGSPVTDDHKEIDPDTGLQKGYVVLCPEERKKGFVRPLRMSYKHVGIKPKYPLRQLTDRELEEHKECGYVSYEKYPESESPLIGRFWTQADLDRTGCGVVTTMALALAETYARDPKFYGGTYCNGCANHFPVEEFVWDGTDEVVGS